MGAVKVISAMSKAAQPTKPRNTLHAFILCESSVVSDVVKGTKQVQLWEPYRKQMVTAANTAKTCIEKKDLKLVKK